MNYSTPTLRFHPAHFLAFKALPVWIAVAVLGLLTVPRLPEDHAIRELLETAGIMVLMLMVVGRFWTILAMEPGENGQVAIQGPFRYLAHPMEFFFAFGMLGIGFMYESILLGVILFAVCMVASKYWADAGDDMAGTVGLTAAGEAGDLHQQYRQLVPSFFPSVKPSVVPYYGDRLSYNQYTLRRSAWDIVVFIGCIPIIELVQWLQEAGHWTGLVTLP